MTHACYICRHIIFAGMPTADLVDETDENVSHGVCSECAPAEWARIERETNAVLEALNGAQ